MIKKKLLTKKIMVSMILKSAAKAITNNSFGLPYSLYHYFFSFQTERDFIQKIFPIRIHQSTYNSRYYSITSTTDAHLNQKYETSGKSRRTLPFVEKVQKPKVVRFPKWSRMVTLTQGIRLRVISRPTLNFQMEPLPFCHPERKERKISRT